MASAFDACKAIAAANATVNGLIAGRFYLDRMPKGSALPAIVMTRQAAAPILAHDGPVDFDLGRYALSLYHEQHGDIYALENAVFAAYGGTRGTYGGRIIDGIKVTNSFIVDEPESQARRRVVQILVLDKGDA